MESGAQTVPPEPPSQNSERYRTRSAPVPPISPAKILRTAILPIPSKIQPLGTIPHSRSHDLSSENVLFFEVKVMTAGLKVRGLMRKVTIQRRHFSSSRISFEPILFHFRSSALRIM